MTSKTKVFLGVPGSEWSGGGYQPATTVNSIANDLISQFGAGKGWFGGVMMWVRFTARIFVCVDGRCHSLGRWYRLSEHAG